MMPHQFKASMMLLRPGYEPLGVGVLNPDDEVSVFLFGVEIIV